MPEYDSLIYRNGRAFVRVRECDGWVMREATAQEVELLIAAYEQASQELAKLRGQALDSPTQRVMRGVAA